MGLDPSIPLSVRPPQVTPPAEAMGQQLSLRNAVNQGQLQQQSIQAAQMENQERQLQLQSQQAIRQAYMDSDGDYDKLPMMAAKNGALPKDVMALNQTITQMRLHHAQLDETTLKNNAAKADQLGGLFEPIITAPPEQKQALYENAVRAGQQKGLISDPNYSTQYPGDDSVKLLVNQFKGAKQLNEEAHQRKIEQSAQQTADARKLAAESGKQKTNLELLEKKKQDAASELSLAKTPQEYQQKLDSLEHGVATRFLSAVPPEQFDPKTSPQILRQVGMTPEQQTTTQHGAETLALAKKREEREAVNAAENIRLKKLEVDPFNMMGGAAPQPGGATTAPGAAPQPGATGAPQPGAAPVVAGGKPVTIDTHGDDFLGALPQAIGSQVKALAEGRMAFPAGFALKSPYWQKMISMVSQYDPSFDAVNYNARASTRKAFTSGSEAKQINALQTLAGHLDELSQKADKLDNMGWQTGNTLKNWISSEMGNPQLNNFNTVLHKVADEDVRAYRGSGGSEKDIEQRLKDFNTSNSPAKLHGAIGETAKLVESKILALKNQYEQGMGTTADPFKVLTPETRATIDRLKAKGEGEPVATSGKATQPAATRGPAGPPPPPASVPAGAQVKYSPSTKQHYYSIDQGKTWQIAK